VAGAIVVRRGPQLFLVPPPPAHPTGYSGVPGPVNSLDGGGAVARIPSRLLESLRALPAGTLIRADSAPLGRAISDRMGVEVLVATTTELRLARHALPLWDPREERRIILLTAHDALERALRTPEEILITLTREEERVERAVGRESRAAESFLAVPGSSLSDYARQWTTVRASLDRHHEMLTEVVARHARSVVPNLSAVVGERAAARLVSAAGGVAALARMRAGRIQLLGTRRRPSPDRGPRYGILYRASGMSDVPAGRRGAYARSLGAIAAIAIRADASTHASISSGLLARRDRRIAQLKSGAR
jgi:hypothetical protein